MRIHWGLCLTGGLLAGLMLGSYLSQPEQQAIMRGYKISLPGFSVGTESGEQATVPAAAPAAPPAVAGPSPRPADAVSGSGGTLGRPRLNLQLPDLDWDNSEWHQPSQRYPDFFYPGRDDASRLNLSGRLHWDESEDAETKPITDTILGAELELQVRLP